MAAARAIGAMKLGRIDDETTANVGLIEGGTATNVVAERCRVEAEVRSLDDAKASAGMSEMVDTLTWAASDTETDVDVSVEEQFRAYRIPPADPVVVAAEAALRDCGVSPVHRTTGGGSDANAFAAKGFRCLNVANGTEANHTADERVSEAALDKMLDGYAPPARSRRGGLGGGKDHQVLSLRRGRVVSIEEANERVIRLTVELEGESRPAIAYTGMTGSLAQGDEVIVNVEAADLGLGSGGFDIVHAGPLRDGADGRQDAHVMKLNYTSLQHAVSPLEEGLERARAVARDARRGAGPSRPARRARPLRSPRRAPGTSVGYVQTAGGALPGALSDVVADLLDRGLIADHVTAGPCFGGRYEAITVEGALDAGARRLGWDFALVGPGPGILGSASALGHGGLAALSSAHAALSLGCRVVLAPRLSSCDRRERHRGLSHHTATVLELLLHPLEVALPAAERARERSSCGRPLRGAATRLSKSRSMSSSTRISKAACRRRRWGARPPRIGSSSSRRSRAAPRSRTLRQRAVERSRMSFERVGGEKIWEGHIGTVQSRAVPPRRRRGRAARSGRASRRGR